MAFALFSVVCAYSCGPLTLERSERGCLGDLTAAERPTDAYIKARVIEEFQTLMNSYPKGDNGQYKRIQAKKVISAGFLRPTGEEVAGAAGADGADLPRREGPRQKREAAAEAAGQSCRSARAQCCPARR
eukprot:259987-Prorocentrum_minimum.AAC.1